MMHPTRRLAFLALAASALILHGAPSPSAKTAATPDSSALVFSFFPKAFQKNPRVEFNLISEMTNAGRKAPPPSPAQPAYYVSQPGGFVQLGHGAAAREKPPAVERMEKVLEQSLAHNGYLRSTPDHPPGIIIIYSWGSHSAPSADDPETGPTIPNHVLIDELIARARLVGGDKFTAELIKAMNEEGASRSGIPRPREDPDVPAQPSAVGDVAMPGIFSPIERFRRSNDQHPSLMEDAGNSIYFVVASAYEFASAASKNKILLWRTKMTVNAGGISMPETLPALIAAAAPYFGRDMTGPEILGQRINREGKVEIGTSSVVGYTDEAKPAAPAKDAAPAAGRP